VRPARLFALLVLLAAVAGCDSGSDAERSATVPTESPGLRSSEGRLIRDWLQALNRGDYGRAAGFFAPGALVDQGTPLRLRDRAAARFFNATLPCRADLVKLVDEGRKVLASFSLRAGPGGPCEGMVRVRFRFDGKDRFSEFRQLPGEEDRPGDTV
jgi:SnoaL-like domain